MKLTAYSGDTTVALKWATFDWTFKARPFVAIIPIACIWFYII